MIERLSKSIGWPSSRVKFLSIVLLLNVVGFIYYINFLTDNGYLPSPFIYDKSNTFMDLFNTMYWAYDNGRYTEWRSVYPPLNFIILKIINFICSGSQYGDPEMMRENSVSVVLGFILIYLIVPILVLKTKLWESFPNHEKFLLYFIFVLSTPMLFALERGNIVLIAPVFLALCLSSLGFSRALSIAVLINLKPYFAILMFNYLIKRDWSGFLNCAILSGLIFFISGLLLDNHFYLFFVNLLSFSQEEGLFSLREVMAMPSSISAFAYALKDSAGFTFASSFQNSIILFNLINGTEIVKWLILAFSMMTMLKQSDLIDSSEILTLLMVLITNLGVWVGGYSVILYVALIPVLIKLNFKHFYIIGLGLLALPIDMITLFESPLGEQYCYLSDSVNQVIWTLGAGSFIRSIVNISLLFLLSIEFMLRKQSIRNN